MKIKPEHLPTTVSSVEKMWWDNGKQCYVLLGQYGEVVWIAYWDGFTKAPAHIYFSADMLEKTNA